MPIIAITISNTTRVKPRPVDTYNQQTNGRPLIELRDVSSLLLFLLQAAASTMSIAQYNPKPHDANEHGVYLVHVLDDSPIRRAIFSTWHNAKQWMDEQLCNAVIVPLVIDDPTFSGYAKNGQPRHSA
jgi:hypothetical protein